MQFDVEFSTKEMKAMEDLATGGGFYANCFKIAKEYRDNPAMSLTTGQRGFLLAIKRKLEADNV